MKQVQDNFFLSLRKQKGALWHLKYNGKKFKLRGLEIKLKKFLRNKIKKKTTPHQKKTKNKTLKSQFRKSNI